MRDQAPRPTVARRARADERMPRPPRHEHPVAHRGPILVAGESEP
jgi:hypothetical protein